MTSLGFYAQPECGRTGLKGPLAEQWLAQQWPTAELPLPPTPNTWAAADGLWVARLGSSEFFLVAAAGTAAGETVESIERQLSDAAPPVPGVYPVLRDDAGFILSGAGTLEVLAEVCNVDFGSLRSPTHPAAGRAVVMTLMIGVAVLVVQQGEADACRYDIWCDPTYAHYLAESLRRVVTDCGGSIAQEN